MDTLLGFVPKLLGLVGNGLDAAQSGVKALTGMSEGNPKKAGVMAVVLGWFGVDPTAVNFIGKVFVKIGAYLTAF